MKKNIETRKGWGITLRNGALYPAVEPLDLKENQLSLISGAGAEGCRLVRVRVIRETDWLKIQAMLRKEEEREAGRWMLFKKGAATNSAYTTLGEAVFKMKLHRDTGEE